MKCPILLEGLKPVGQTNFEMRECIKEECAWWDTPLQICGIRTIGCELEAVSRVLEKIENKMPHEAQFRR